MSPRPRRKRDCINCKVLQLKDNHPETGVCYLGHPVIQRRMGPQGLACVWVPCGQCPKPKTWTKLMEEDKKRNENDAKRRRDT